MTPILSAHPQLWDLEKYNDHWKVQVHKIGVTCSLGSSDPNTPVVLKDFTGTSEQWIRLDVDPDPVPIDDVTGPRMIKSVAYHGGRAIQLQDGNLISASAPHDPHSFCNQRWIISKADDPNTYVLESEISPGQYLDAVGKNVLSSSTKRSWNIVKVKDDNFTLEIPKVGFCSLQSDEEGAPVLIAEHSGGNEEWVLEKYPLN